MKKYFQLLNIRKYILTYSFFIIIKIPNQNRKCNDIRFGINKPGQQKLNFTKKKDILSHVSTAHFPSNLDKNPPNLPIKKTLQHQNLSNSETMS